ncbi:hypothetical protein [uncultured Methanobrevibacter sp.]|uniref:hypothetical protein n=1 Tax=uncultured Methanobrevibacter sp. TaxID=253161 RepID=UPI0025FD1818|nr:hypothetical protein [uncultured Methanobrevibacter sp.]
MSHFQIDVELPDYLLNQTFNEVFLDGDLTKNDNDYKIVVRTRQDVTHMMFIKPEEEFPIIIMSELPNGLLNGMKFSKSEGEGIPISKL